MADSPNRKPGRSDVFKDTRTHRKGKFIGTRVFKYDPRAVEFWNLMLYRKNTRMSMTKLQEELKVALEFSKEQLNVAMKDYNKEGKVALKFGLYEYLEIPFEKLKRNDINISLKRAYPQQ